MPALQIGCPVENEGAIVWSMTSRIPSMSHGSRPISSGASSADGRVDRFQRLVTPAGMGTLCPQPTVPSSAVIFTSTAARRSAVPAGPQRT